MSTLTSYPMSGPTASPVIMPIDHELYRWMQGRIHPYRWAIGSPAWGATAEQILARLSGMPPKDGGARKCGPYQIARCRELGDRLYVTSSSANKGVIWCDIDAHSQSQTLTDAAQAAQIIEAEISGIVGWQYPGFYLWPFPSSPHGYHVICPVSYGRYAPSQVREIYGLLQDGVRRLLHCHGSPVAQTTEVKGHPPFICSDGSLYCGTLCRLPVNQPWWGHEALERLRMLHDTPMAVVLHIAEALRSTYPPLPLHESHHGASAQTQRRSTQPSPPPPYHSVVQAIVPVRSSLYVADLRSEPNSLKRQHRALLRLARHLGRVPAHSDALDFIHDEDLYTGNWLDNLPRRKKRVEGILAYIARTFDPTKANGQTNGPDRGQALERMRRFAARHFPRGTTYSPTNPSQNLPVISAEHIAVFLTITEFCLIHSPNRDSSVPRKRFESLWRGIMEDGLTTARWNRHYWLRLREFFVSHGVIEITDRQYGPGKAMRWAIGPNFPLSGQTTHKMNEAEMPTTGLTPVPHKDE